MARSDIPQYQTVAFYATEKDSKRVMRCEYCEYTTASRTIDRLKKHREKCVPPGGSQLCFTNAGPSSSAKGNRTNSAKECASPQKKIRRAASGSNKHTITEEQRLDIDNAIQSFFFECNIPLDVMESTAFKCMIHALHPAYSSFLGEERLPLDDINAESEDDLDGIKSGALACQSIKSEVVPRRNHSEYDPANEHLLEMFTQSLHSFDLIDEAPFINLLKALNADYILPSRSWVGNTALPNLYNRCKMRVKEMIGGAESVCLTMDCWTAESGENFCSVTGHFLNEQFESKTVLLDCVEMAVGSTPQTLSGLLFNVVRDYEIDTKIVLAVADNSNQTIPSAVCCFGWPTLDCLAHNIDYLVKDALQVSEVEDLICRVRENVAFFRSISTSDNFDPLTKALQLKEDCPKRWTRTLSMLKQFNNSKELVSSTLADLANDEVSEITSTDWELIKDLVDLLEPWESAINMCSEGGYQLGSMVAVIITGLQSVVDEVTVMDLHEKSAEVANKLKEGIFHRLVPFTQNEILSKATFCDPRFKNILIGDDIRQSIIEEMTSGMTRLKTQRPSKINSGGGSRLSIWGAFDSLAHQGEIEGMPSSGKLAIEVNLYIEYGLIPRSNDPLRWWEEKRGAFPELAKIARKYLGVVATSVPCNRLFNKDGLSFSSKRSLLSGKHLPKQLYVHANSKYLE